MNSQDPKIKLSRVLAELKKEYLEKFPNKLALLRQITAERNWQRIEDEYHKLKGTGKTYGFPEISIVCQKLEDLAQIPAGRNPETFEKALTLLEKMYVSYLQNQTLDLESEPLARSLLALKLN